MNRLIVAALITLALIVLVSPGLVGRLAEKSVEDNLNFAASETDGVIVTTESFGRKWFTSEGRYRITLRDGPVRALLDDDASGQTPSLIIDTHVDHGLVPLTSVSRESGSLMPGLANTVSTMKIDAGNGEMFQVPGKIYSKVGFTGETTSRFLMEAGSRDTGNSALKWQGADVTVRTNPATGAIAYEGEILPFSFLDESGGVKFGKVTIDGQQEPSPYGIRIGNARIEMDALSVETTDGPGTAFGRFSIDASTELDGDRINGAASLHVSDVPMPALGESDLALDVVFNGLHARSVQQIVEALRNARASADPSAALADMYPLIEPDIQMLLTSGLEIRFDRFDVTLPDSEVTTRLKFELPASDPVAGWPALLLALNASADVRIPVKVFELAEIANPEAAMLIAMGFLKKVDGSYEMRAEYTKGLVTVNGAPIPIPLTGL